MYSRIRNIISVIRTKYIMLVGRYKTLNRCLEFYVVLGIISCIIQASMLFMMFNLSHKISHLSYVCNACIQNVVNSIFVFIKTQQKL